MCKPLSKFTKPPLNSTPLADATMTGPTKELAFKNDVIAQMAAAGWKLGDPAGYNRSLSDPKKATAFAKLVFDLIKMAG